MITRQVVDLCAKFRRQNYGWAQIEQMIFNNGFKQPNGKPIHNAALATATLLIYPDLRKQKRTIRRRRGAKKVGKATHARRQRVSTITQSVITAMKKVNLSAEQILAVLEKIE